MQTAPVQWTPTSTPDQDPPSALDGLAGTPSGPKNGDRDDSSGRPSQIEHHRSTPGKNRIIRSAESACLVLHYLNNYVTAQTKQYGTKWHAQQIVTIYSAQYFAEGGAQHVEQWVDNLIRRHNRKVDQMSLEQTIGVAEEKKKISRSDLICEGSGILLAEVLKEIGYHTRAAPERMGDDNGVEEQDRETSSATIDGDDEDVAAIKTPAKAIPVHLVRRRGASSDQPPASDLPAMSTSASGLEHVGQKRRRIVLSQPLARAHGHTQKDQSHKNQTNDDNTPLHHNIVQQTAVSMGSSYSNRQKFFPSDTESDAKHGFSETGSLYLQDSDIVKVMKELFTRTESVAHLECEAFHVNADGNAVFDLQPDDELKHQYSIVVGRERIGPRTVRIVEHLSVSDLITSLVAAFMWKKLFVPIVSEDYTDYAATVRTSMGDPETQASSKMKLLGTHSLRAKVPTLLTNILGTKLDTFFREAYIDNIRSKDQKNEKLIDVAHELADELADTLHEHLHAQPWNAPEDQRKHNCHATILHFSGRLEPVFYRALQLKCELSASTEKYRFDWRTAGEPFQGEFMKSAHGSNGSVVAALFPGLFDTREGLEKPVFKTQVIVVDDLADG